ncbi:MAG: efflux RND transporter periplasmic adaptor subunit [Acidiferrobacterales bacterium]|jgi:multidrug efflux pump subunit AcrA (membrane-fusion protein)|nr:efflux RND transporter periplasmic adaptor subunit [Acidiferrobacterales bacterium]
MKLKDIRRSIWLWSAAGAISLGLVALGIYALTKNRADYVSPKYGPIVEAIYGLGKVKTDNVFEVKLGVIKTLQKLYVREGQVVKKGDPLVRFESDLLFRAPFSGTITNVAFHEDQYVFPQQTVVRLEDLSTKYIEVSLEQQGALRVKPGLPVRVVFESIRGEVLKGKVSAVFSRNDEFLAHIDVPLADNILPGMTADVAIEVDRKDKVLLVPLSAISDGRIKLKRDGKRKTVQLKIGSVDGNWAEVVEGDVSLEDQIIVPRRTGENNL